MQPEIILKWKQLIEKQNIGTIILSIPFWLQSA